MATATVSERSSWGGGKSPFSVSYGKLMMWYFLMSDAFTFGAFLISYGTIRFSSASWPDPNKVFDTLPFLGGGYPLVFVSLMTFILIASSVTMVLAVQAGHRRDKKAVIKWVFWTIIGGAMFLGCQAWEWSNLIGEGAFWGKIPTTGHEGAKFMNANKTVPTTNFSNYFFTITGFHGFHVFSGVVINIIMLLQTMNGTFERRGHYEMIEKAGLYWHFVDLVWVFVFTCFYLF